MDAFDRFWKWANKPVDNGATIAAELHRALAAEVAENSVISGFRNY
jgi:hypothetical protein